MEEGAVRETPTAFCSLDYPFHEEEVKPRIERGESGEKTFRVEGDQTPTSAFVQCVPRAIMVTSLHLWGPRRGID